MVAFWTPEEDEAVRAYYPLHGPAWMGWDMLLPGRTAKAISQRAHKLGVPLAPEIIARSRSRAKGAGPWTEGELDALRCHYKERGPSWEGWADILPNRTEGAIRSKAKDLGLAKKYMPRHKHRDFTEPESIRIFKVVLKLANSLNADPYDVAMEIVRLGEEYERQWNDQ